MVQLIRIPQEMLESLLQITVKGLLINHNTLTTLDIKNEFRNNYKNIYIDQNQVSNYMMNNFTSFNLGFTDNGKYRTYFKMTNVAKTQDYYNSMTKGLMLISDMHITHLKNAIVKEINELTGYNKENIKDILSIFENKECTSLLKEFINRVTQ